MREHFAGHGVSDETRAKMSAAMREHFAEHGVSDETRAKRSASLREHFAEHGVSDETRAKRSASLREHYRCFHCGAACTRDGAREKMQPVDGLAGRYECRDEGACERRIAKSLPTEIVRQLKSIGA